MARPTAEKKEHAKKLYIRGWTVAEIANEVGVSKRTIYNWIERDHWDLLAPPDSPQQAISRRINILAAKENKTKAELEELTTLSATFSNMKISEAEVKLALAKAEAISKGKYVPHADDAPDIKEENRQNSKKRRQRKKSVKNDISDLTEEQFQAFREKHFFGYQLLWHEKKRDPLTRRNRFILKSRQIGATYYFAYEAFEDAVLTGDNQLFLSASRDQAEVFKAYIIAIAADHFDTEIKGTGVIKLSNGAEIRFLSTNSRTAQSYHGHLYIDEVFWIPHFNKLYKVASGMAAHKKWRRTYFSTPSAQSHEAYTFWNGEKHNERRDEKDKAEFDVSWQKLKNGLLGADKIWRHIVTVKDAEKQGCDLFDIDELQDEYTKSDFDNLFMCKFIDDAESVFALSKLMQCMSSQENWPDYNENAARPFGNRPVAIGYDPSRTRDNASMAILAIPMNVLEKWRVLKTYNYHGQNFQFQAAEIHRIYKTHNVQHIGIDVTGIGLGVFELVEQFYKRATPITYNIETKTQLVLKALDVVEHDRLEFAAGDKDIPAAFLMIKQTTTSSGGHITYAADRSGTTGHADVAWSIMHALIYEPIAPRRKTRMSLAN